MVAIEPDPTKPKAKRWWFPSSWPRFLILMLLLVGSGIYLEAWIVPLPPSWMADYDKESYMQIRKAIAADKRHLLGK